MADEKGNAVPLVEQLRFVPLDAVLRIDTPNALGCMDTHSIPVGRLCHEAADALGSAPVATQAPRLWLWKNFVDGRPEYWAFDNPYPTNLADGDPQTLGEPCGYAIFKPSRDGSHGRTEESVIAAVKRVWGKDFAGGK